MTPSRYVYHLCLPDVRDGTFYPLGILRERHQDLYLRELGKWAIPTERIADLPAERYASTTHWINSWNGLCWETNDGPAYAGLEHRGPRRVRRA